jgi:hypothetical protein
MSFTAAIPRLLILAMLAGCNKRPELETPAAPVVYSVSSVSTDASNADEGAQAAARHKAQLAILDKAIMSDAQGQWAETAKASSTNASDMTDDNSPHQPSHATGMPDSQHYGDTATSWATKTKDGGIEWLELEYTKPVNATEVRIRQNNAPGAVARIELFDDDGAAHTVWQGPDTTVYPANEIAWLSAKFDKTAYKTHKLKITLATNTISGWNEIDAVQLVGE